MGIIKYIASQFSRPRGFIGLLCCISMNIINEKMYSRTVEKVLESDHILEIGFGNGYLIKKIYKRNKCKIDGIDISEDMIALATSANKKGVENLDISLKVGDVCNLAYEDDTFDDVCTINTIYFWEDTLKGLREIRRVLKTGGKFYNTVYSQEFIKTISHTKDYYKFFSKEDYINLGKEAGFKDVHIESIAKDKSFIVIYEK